MIHILLLALAWSVRVYAIENLDCEYALSLPRPAVIAPGHEITLARGQVLFRGHLEAVYNRKAERYVFGVRDEMVQRRVFRSDRHGWFILAPGDEIYFLDQARSRVVMKAHYDEFSEKRTWTADGREELIHPNLPLFLMTPDDLGSRLSPEQARRLFMGREQVVILRRLSAAAYTRARNTYLPLIQAHEAHLRNPERFVRLNDEQNIELAHFEAAHFGKLKWQITQRAARLEDSGDGRLGPPMTIYDVNLMIEEPDGTAVSLARDGTIAILGENDDVLLQFTLDQDKLTVYPPYDAFEEALLSSLHFDKRAVIVKAK